MTAQDRDVSPTRVGPDPVIIISGPPGAGKSTTSQSLAARYRRAVHLHTDDFWHYIVSGGIAPYRPESDTQNQTVVRVIAGAASTYARGGFVVVVDGVVGPWMLDHYRDTLDQPGDPAVHYVVLRPDRAVTLARAQQRTHPGALTDEGPVLSLWDQFSDLGLWETHVIDTSEQGPAETVQAVADAVQSGRYRLRTR